MGGFRLAGYKDLAVFKRLWMEYLSDTHLRHGGLEPCSQNLWVFSDFFVAYTRGSLFGCCVLWEDNAGVPRGTLLIGEDSHPSPFQTSFGKVAHLWGVYMEPEYRKQHLAQRMLLFVRPLITEMGFQTGHTNMIVGNTESENLARSLGGIPTETTWSFSFSENPMKGN